MFRSVEDYNRGYNCFALALHRTGSTELVDAFMSNHIHCGVIAEETGPLVKSFRNGYNKYFNNKYGREGGLGEMRYFCLELQGVRHILAALSYILRNGLHHGLSLTPFGYPFCSSNSLFRRDLGKTAETELLSSPNEIREHLPAHFGLYPTRYKMSKEGIFLRESVADVSYVELLYVSPKSFLYYMNRRTSEAWLQEQEKDENGITPVSLNQIEEGVFQEGLMPEASMSRMLINERGAFALPPFSDIDVCTLIDKTFVPKYKRDSVYLLTEGEKKDIASVLAGKFKIGDNQLQRCLVINQPRQSRKT